jgi:viologen exporter family transport system permease protein
VSGLGKLYAQQFKTTFAATLQYRASLAIWMIGHVLEPLIYLIVWSTVSNTSGGSVGDYSTADFAAYFIAMMLVNHVTYTWIMFEYEYRVREGMLSFALLRPVHPIHSDIADNISSKLITLPFMLAIAVILGMLFHPVFHIPLWAAAVFAPALFLAFLLRFLLEWTLALSAFWTTRVGAINQTYFVLILFLSGQIAPLELFPPVVRSAAEILPFRWMIGFPVELILGRLNPAEAAVGIVAQTVWILLAFLLLRAVWRAGVRVYSAVGA